VFFLVIIFFSFIFLVFFLDCGIIDYIFVMTRHEQIYMLWKKLSLFPPSILSTIFLDTI
jgi:hypothetical protein